MEIRAVHIIRNIAYMVVAGYTAMQLYMALGEHERLNELEITLGRDSAVAKAKNITDLIPVVEYVFLSGPSLVANWYLHNNRDYIGD